MIKNNIKAKLLLLGYTFKPIENGDDVYTLDEWISMCEDGGFIDYDGMGDYAIGGEKASPPYNGRDDFSPWVQPSDVKNGKIDKRFTHIVWYNR